MKTLPFIASVCLLSVVLLSKLGPIAYAECPKCFSDESPRTFSGLKMMSEKYDRRRRL